MKEITLPLTRQTWTAIIGMLVMFFWSMLCCLRGVIAGPLGDSTGVLLFGHTVGNISRYYDPFNLGVFASIVTFCWNKIPPVRPYVWVALSRIDQMILGVSVTTVASIVFDYFISSYFGSNHLPGLFILISMIFTPLGMRGVSVSLIACALFSMISYGSVPAILLVMFVYLGKWVNWWVVNIIRHGFKGARSALESTRDMSVMQQS